MGSSCTYVLEKVLGTCVYDFPIRYGSCTDGVVYLVCFIYDKYEMLLYSLEYFFVVGTISSSVEIGYEK